MVVLITGAKGGLGTQLTSAFLEGGATVVGTSRSISPAEFPHERFFGIPADLGSLAEAQKLVDAVLERDGRIDALVHAAGGFTGGTPIHEADDAAWDGMMNVNARAAFHVFRAVLPSMRKAGAGRIVAIASRQALEPAANVAAYSASKAALLSLVRTAALENRDLGITVNAILPGTIDTEANRKWGSEEERKKWVSPRKIAELAVFLVSDAAGQITGAAVPVYGQQL